MKTKEFISKAESMLEEAFPNYPIRLFPDPDDAATFFAYIFCVPDGAEQDEKRRVRAFIRGQLNDAEWDVIPSIKNLSITREHYPEYLRCSSSDNPVPNSVVLEVAYDSRMNQQDAFDFHDDDLGQMNSDSCNCTMPTLSDSYEGKFDFAA